MDRQTDNSDFIRCSIGRGPINTLLKEEDIKSAENDTKGYISSKFEG